MTDPLANFDALPQLKAAFDAAKPDDQGKMPTQDFLAAAEKILPIFDILGSKTFDFVRSDVSGNITKLRAKYDENSAIAQTLQDAVQSEIDAKTTNARNSATDALLWLKRGLQFVATLLSEVAKNAGTKLSEDVSKAYNDTLSKAHNWGVRKIFGLALRATPEKSVFLQRIGSSEADALAVISAAVSSIDAAVANVQSFYVEQGFEKYCK